MKLVLTGATGAVGRDLVRIYAERGATLLLVGRKPEELRRLFPQHSTCGYEQLSQAGEGYDILVHLAVLNNDADAPYAEFLRANVDLLLKTIEDAKRAGIPHVVNISTTHALDARNVGHYAASKRIAYERVKDIPGVRTLFLPFVLSTDTQASLPSWMPRPLVPVVLGLASALKPTVHVDRLADAIIASAGNGDWPDQIVSDGQGGNLVYRLVKRGVDLLFAVTVTALLWWLMLLVWGAVKLDTPGPGIFAQQRLGRDQRLFICYKFRTMAVGTANVATHEAASTSVTGIGRFLRGTKLDELPQIWNIFRNEISLVGPRPCLPVQSALIEARQRRGVFSVTPGISGLAQVRGIDMSRPDELARCDQEYVALQSLLLDLKIIIATARGKGQGDRVR